MLSQLILRSYPTILAICLWVIPINSFLYYGDVSKYGFNFWFGLFGFVVTFIGCAIVYGFLLLLIDIHQLLMDIRQSVMKE